MKGKVAAGSGLNLVRYAKELSLEEPEPKAEAEKWRRTYVTITRGGQTVAVINGAADSWEMIEAKAMEHHPGTREWVFCEVNAFIEKTLIGEKDELLPKFLPTPARPTKSSFRCLQNPHKYQRRTRPAKTLKTRNPRS